MDEKNINLTPSSDAVMDQPEDAFELINKYGTYNIQPTADTANRFPGISQGLSEKDAQILKKEKKQWLKEQDTDR